MTTRTLTNSFNPQDTALGELPQYQADEGALTTEQLGQIKLQTPKDKKHSVRNSLFALKPDDFL